ncbi:hypothetical protein PIB30_080356 [Stylosanthes scabra]|uniref:Uncharacterized protein n=1 Tax=Stylosanthes scabra TaxID=79078 RepID=A0ABU6YP05_9FABA|nr:hypothetical protein [Stylosanthes scabra]
MAGAFSGSLSASAFTLVFARLGVSFCIFTNCTLHRPEMGFCLSGLITGDDFLMHLRRGAISLGVLEFWGERLSDNDAGPLGDLGIPVSPISSGWVGGRSRISSVAGFWITTMLKLGRSSLTWRYGEAELLRPPSAEDGGGRGDGFSFDSSACSGSPSYLRGSSSSPAVPVPAPTTSVPPAPSAKAKKSSGVTAAKPFFVDREEGVKEDLAADLRQKKRKRKVPEASAEEAALGVDSAWEHEVSPIDRAFPPDYNFREALDAGLTQGPSRKLLDPLLPE